MPRRLVSAVLPFIAVAALASPALADNSYIVSGPAPDGAGSCTPFIAGTFTCTTLRAAVTQANQTAGTDTISVAAGKYPLTSGQLVISGDVAIIGAGARTTSIEPSGSRAFTINSGVTAQIALVTISGGNASTGDGGNILNNGTLSLSYSRVTGGTAGRGGGIANFASGTAATADVYLSLVDHNTATSQGGGIANIGQTSAASLTVWASTVAINTGGGISSTVNGTTTLYQDTIARNTGTGLTIANTAMTLYGTILANNGTNCGTTKPSDTGGNIEDRADCGLGSSSKPNVDPGLGAALENKGGETDVLTIPASSPAVGFVQPCYYPIDQRGAQRVTDINEACDAGAFEESIVIPPQPTPTPVATPTPTPTASPTPVPGTTVVVREVKGKVRVRRPRSNEFVDLDGTAGIPVGSTVDTKQGTVQLTSQPKKGAKPQSANFFDGVFKIGQTKTTTDVTLNEALAACKKGKASAAAKKPKTRKLWGDGSGSFRTRGQYSAATVRGTKWLVQDTCAGTLTRVTKGAVTVRDLVKRKTIIVRAGKRYLARPKR
jgi:hypothetical protein